MSGKNYGPSVSGYLDPSGRNWENPVFQSGKPVLDKELNLVEDLSSGFGQSALRRAMPSGWLSDDFLSSSDMASAIFTPVLAANKITFPNLRAHVNGWLLQVAYSGDNTQNALNLANPPPTGLRTDLVILEVWRKLISAAPSIDGKSPAARIWRNGNVKIAAADDLTINIADDILDGALGAESTKRVQIQYRLRVISGIDIIANPYGINDPTVVANSVPASAVAPDGVATVFNYVNQSPAGDPGLWVAGDGNPANTLGTVDGYMYAIPLLAIPRRNQMAFDKNLNQNGGVSYLTPPSDRPDGLFNDLIDAKDIIDLRSGVSPTGWDYKEILAKNVGFLLDNTLRTEWTLTGIGGGMEGHTILWADEIGFSTAHGGDGVVTGDTPGAEFVAEFDNVRRFFSDRANIEVVTVTVDMPLGGWVAGATVTISPTNLAVYPNAGFNWSSYNPADIMFVDILAARWVGESAGKVTRDALSHINTIIGLGAMPVGNVTLQMGPPPGGVTTERLFVDLVIEWPAGHGLTKTPVDSFAVRVNNPAALPIIYGSGSDSFDYPHREVRLQWVTKPVSITQMADVTIATNPSFTLPERAQSVGTVLKNAAPLVGAVTLDPDGRTVTFLNPADYTNPGDRLDITYDAIRPYEHNTVQLTLFYNARAPQTAKGALLGTSLSLIPRYIDDHIYTITAGSGSADETYPYPTGYNQIGGIFPSLAGTFNGDHELSAGAKTYIAEFNATTGFLQLPAFIGYVPNPEAVTFIRGVGDVDIEGRTFFPTVPGGYIPNAYAQPISDSKRHRNFLPMIAELPADSPLGYKGQLVLVLLIREARFDKVNGVWFDPDPNSSTTVASIFRIKGNLLNKVA